MKTLLLQASDPAAPRIAADILRAGGLVALPTETVYGLGADGLRPEAVDKIFVAKGRPNDNPLILHVTDMAQVETLCHSIPASAYRLAERFWPGPLTMVLPARQVVPKETTAGLSTVAVRCPDCAVTRKVIALAGVPVAAPSANRSGKPSTTTAQHVLHDHDGHIDAVIDAGPCRVGVESTIVDLTEERPRLLRPGGITPEELLEVLGDLVIDKAVSAAVDKDAVVKAPGMKYRHYAPDCTVIIVDGTQQEAQAYIARHWQTGNRVLCFEEELDAFAAFAPLAYGRLSDPDSLLAGLFGALRQVDDPKVGIVFARCPKGSGKTLAVQNRLEKAAGFCRVDAARSKWIVGITGGTGCGKTTALQAFAELGGSVLDCDAIYHELLQQDDNLLKDIENRFPGTVEAGVLNRKKLGNVVFQDENALRDLNKITHSAVRQQVVRLLARDDRPAAIDAIGLFEGDLAQLCKVTVAVTAPEQTRVARLMARDGITEDYAKNRIAAQRPQSEFAALCDYTLCNDGTQTQFREKCLAFFRHLGIMNTDHP